MGRKTGRKRETVGESSLRISKEEGAKHNAIEQMRESLTDYDKNIFECIKTNKKVFDGDFYVVVLTKRERLMQNVNRGYFFARSSCPTPDYDQAVYKYTSAIEDLKFLWVVPSADTVDIMSKNKYLVKAEQYELLGFVLKFIDGSLMRMAKELNGETLDSIFLEN